MRFFFASNIEKSFEVIIICYELLILMKPFCKLTDIKDIRNIMMSYVIVILFKIQDISFPLKEYFNIYLLIEVLMHSMWSKVRLDKLTSFYKYNVRTPFIAPAILPLLYTFWMTAFVQFCFHIRIIWWVEGVYWVVN